MILKYVGYSISAILFIVSFFFVMSIYTGYKYMEKSLPTQKSLKNNRRYLLLSALSLGLSLFVLLTVENGFSWDNVFVSLFLVFMASSLIILNYFIMLKTGSYLKKKNFSFKNYREILKDPNQLINDHTNKKIVDKSNEQ